MPKYSSIYLIGSRGSGKTTIGKHLANHFNWDFIDTDACIQEKAARSIAQIIEQDGWTVFRDLESKILQSSLQSTLQNNTIIATGGGIVLRKENQVFMRKHGIVCFLDAPVEILHARLSKDLNPAQRPALSELPLLLEIESTLKERLPLYQKTAHLILDTTKSIEYIVQNIERYVF